MFNWGQALVHHRSEGFLESCIFAGQMPCQPSQQCESNECENGMFKSRCEFVFFPNPSCSHLEIHVINADAFITISRKAYTRTWTMFCNHLLRCFCSGLALVVTSLYFGFIYAY